MNETPRILQKTEKSDDAASHYSRIDHEVGRAIAMPVRVEGEIILKLVLTPFISLFFGLFLLANSAFAALSEEDCIHTSSTIEQRLGCLKGITFKDVTGVTTPFGAKQFEIQFEQLVDHNDPSQGVFSQRLALIHRGENEPMILQTSGYSIFGVRDTALSSMFATNQLQIEHRFFSNSRPEKLDWSKLDIKQSADDFHAITVKFKKIYSARWVNTGASKGGMTSTYHRRFYPNDLDGTVADVAPLSFDTADTRYIGFVQNVGGEKYQSCRENLTDIQTKLLENRDVLVPSISGMFNQLGSAEVAFEHSILESSFVFWQYTSPEDYFKGCAALPKKDASPMEMFRFMQQYASVSDYSDEGISGFMPYYFQAATQLGGPASDLETFKHLLRHPYNIDQYTPKGVSYSYSNEAMKDIDQWIRTEADNIIFVYGELDPWSAAAYPISESGKAVYQYYVPGGNHGSKYTSLPAEQRAHATSIIATWLNKKPVIRPMVLLPEPTLEDLELEARKRIPGLRR